MKLFLALACGLTVVGTARPASSQQRDPQVSSLAVVGEDRARVEFTVRWPNGWRNDRNHDAAWIVLRGPDPARGPLRLAATGHRVRGDGGADAIAGECIVPVDRIGAFVQPAAVHRGDVGWRVSLALDEAAPSAVSAWAVGMVAIPAGAFTAGDDDPMCVRFGAFHGCNRAGEPVGPVWIDSEGELAVGKEPGQLWYETNQYRGDQQGPIPSTFPKGTRAFYVMKHELTQGRYAAFLNALPTAWQTRRAPLELDGKETETCSIARDGDRFVASSPDRPCNFVSWDDTCALFDWLGLRPMTELEFEKAARGPERAVRRDYPWGSASVDGLERTVEPSRDLRNATAADEAALDDASRARLGASHYWVMDLAGSLWERVVSAGSPVGRAFAGTHGDGRLDTDGNATNADWPRGSADGRAAPGVGYRGGAEYFAGRKPDDLTNPESPVAFRTYGAWDGAYRYKTYSARGCRTSPRRAPAELEDAVAKALAAELLERRERDQAVRSRDFASMSADERRRAGQEAMRVDRENTARMREIVDAFGWPTVSMVGADASAAAFLLVQHADQQPAFQARCLPMLADAVARGEASRTGLAYLTDRVRVKQRRPQVYGTQYSAEQDGDGNATYLPPLVEDAGAIDARRAAMGLGPWIDYERRMATLQQREPVEVPRAWDGSWPIGSDGPR